MKTQRFQAWVGIALTALIVSVFAPSSVAAAACPSVEGKVVKVKSSYWLVKDNQRYEFVDLVAVQTWDKTPKTVKLECVKDYPVVGVVNYRPGSRLIKKAGEATVYAVGKNMTVHAVDVAAVKQWYGLNWRALVRTVPAAKFQEFTVGAPLTVDGLHDGVLVRQTGKPQVYYVTDGQLAKVEGRLRPVLSGKVLILPAKVFAKLTISGKTVKATDIASDPITAAVPVTEGVAPTTTVSPTTAPVNTVPNTNTTVPPVDTTNSAQNFTGANYTGPFPAPEGMVLEGFIGAAKYFEPTGTGMYRFAPKIDGQRSINCLDSTRTVYRSKGKNYDAGFKEGIFYGIKDGDVFFPKYNDAPRGSGNVGNQYYNEGFRVGYKHGYEVGNDYGTTYDCRTTAYKPGDYDADGWSKTTSFANAKNLAAVYFPGMAGGFAGMGKTSPQAYAWAMNTETVGMRIEDTELNKTKPAVNLSRIEILEAVPEGAETSMTMKQVAQMSYDAALQYTNTKYNRICTLTEPTIEDQTYGGKTFTLLTFIQICKPEANKEATWKLQAYAFAKGSTSGNVFTTTFISPFNLKKAGADELDATKVPSNDFIAQFLTKLQFN